MKCIITRSLEDSEKYGKITKIELPNKSKIYISNKGWSLVKDKTEILLHWNEIYLAIIESAKQGYIEKADYEETVRIEKERC